jgi:hypothetical protein
MFTKLWRGMAPLLQLLLVLQELLVLALRGLCGTGGSLHTGQVAV